MPLLHFNNPRCLFVHIPKTAGSSIRTVFDQDFTGPWFHDELPDDWKDLFKFGFVRNPFDRLVSAWKMFSQGTDDAKWQLPKTGPFEVTLEETVRMGMDESVPFGHPDDNGARITPELRFKNHVIPQTHPHHGLRHAEFIGRFENLQEDFQVVARRLNLKVRELPKINSTVRCHYRGYFDDNTRKLAAKYYAEDLERFGYSF